MNRTWMAAALVAAFGACIALPANAGGKPGYEDIGSTQQQTYTVPIESYDYSQGYRYGKENDPTAFGTDNSWGNYVDYSQDQSQYSDQYSQYSQSNQYQDFGYTQHGKGGGSRRTTRYYDDTGYDYGSRHGYSAPEERGFFDYDFGRRMLVPTVAEGGGYLMRDAVTGQELTAGRVGGGFVAGGITSFADYAGNHDRRNDAGSRIASNAVGYGVGNVAYRAMAGDDISAGNVVGGVAEGGIVGFGKYMGDEEDSAMGGLMWGGLTRFGGAMANRGISGDKIRGKDLAGEGLRSLVGALGYMGGNEQ